MSELLHDRADGVLVLTINRPERRNAIDLPTAEAIARALDELDDSPDLRAGVLTGAGGFFSAGMDLKAYAQTGERPITASRGGLGIIRRPPSKPLIAAVEGPAMGGGFELALACDLIVASERSMFALPEVKRGQVAAGGGAIRLAQRLPHHLALELLLTGDPLPASRALELGLVNRVVPAEQVLATAVELARAVARNAPLAVAATKRIVAETRTLDFDDAYALQEPIAKPVRKSADAQEGARAFTEKREPIWQGR
jgi:enoyl-CoA hydratase/carnithine racemase